MENWLLEADKFASEDVSKILVGNKNDLEEQRQVIDFKFRLVMKRVKSLPIH